MSKICLSSCLSWRNSFNGKKHLENLTKIYSTNTWKRTHKPFHKTSKIEWKENRRDKFGVDKKYLSSFLFLFFQSLNFIIFCNPPALQPSPPWFEHEYVCGSFTSDFPHSMSLVVPHRLPLTEVIATQVQIKCAVALYSLWFDLICFRSLCKFLGVFVLELWFRFFPSFVRSFVSFHLFFAF